jgi:hypothetical protein
MKERSLWPTTAVRRFLLVGGGMRPWVRRRPAVTAPPPATSPG